MLEQIIAQCASVMRAACTGRPLTGVLDIWMTPEQKKTGGSLRASIMHVLSFIFGAGVNVVLFWVLC
jgi:hypothetical protein